MTDTMVGLLVVGVIFAGLAAAALILAHRTNGLEEAVNTQIHLSSGKANYLPGAACVIATSAEQTPADIVNYARACAKAHEDWLKEQT
jgi:hypothetical protein|tara:strand:+ start:357 stop:620 length:264 start_codon:yes stop_codon:yes gene_type:complete